MRYVSIILLSLLFISCKNNSDASDIEPTEWKYSETIKVEGVNPIGIAISGDTIILSDGDHNRIVYIDETGAILKEITGFERPMHIDFAMYNDMETLLVPEYGRDSIASIDHSERGFIQLNAALDAPAAVSANGTRLAIADFYNNRILFKEGGKEMSFGKEGKGDGDFYYPTDVQLDGDRIYVADAYNNRGQVFDLKGNFIAKFAQNDTLNAATGIFKSSDYIFLTDFENDRVMVYDSKNYDRLQALDQAVEKPTDILAVGDSILYITNYRKGELVKYVK